MDWLIKLYDLPPLGPLAEGVVVRKPIAPEYDLVVSWVGEHFSRGWASETRSALANTPRSLYIALRDQTILGFSCYDTTGRGFVGPIGTVPEARRTGVGAHVLRACLTEMRALGYGYAVAGWVGAPEFFQHAAGAVAIEGSSPSIYRGMLTYPKK